MSSRPCAPKERLQGRDARRRSVSAGRIADVVVASRPDVIFHLAAIVSGEAEADFDKGYRINLDGTRFLFDAIRKVGDGYKPRVVFTSSIAVFGAPFPDAIKRRILHYAADLLRRRRRRSASCCCPTTRAAASWTASASVCRLSAFVRASPTRRRPASSPASFASRWPVRRRSCRFRRRCATGTPARARPSASSSMPPDWTAPSVGARRNLTMPGVSVTVGEQIAALRKVAGDKVAQRIRREPDATIMKIVEGWPRNFAPERASALGFRAERDFEEIIRIHIEDELGGDVGVASLPPARASPAPASAACRSSNQLLRLSTTSWPIASRVWIEAEPTWGRSTAFGSAISAGGTFGSSAKTSSPAARMVPSFKRRDQRRLVDDDAAADVDQDAVRPERLQHRGVDRGWWSMALPGRTIISVSTSAAMARRSA